MTPEEEWLSTLCTLNELAITDIQIAQLSHYRDLLLEWNAKINLISRKDEIHAWDTHLLLAVSHLFIFHFPDGTNVLDLGTGGGLPGIPLSILLPKCNFTLVDSIRKKTTAVASMVDTLGLSNVSVVNARAEEINLLPQHTNFYDIVTARSVSDMTNLLKWSLPFLRRKSNVDTTHDQSGVPRKRSILLTSKESAIEIEPDTFKKVLPSYQALIGADNSKDSKKVQRVRSCLVTLKGPDIGAELVAAKKAFPHVVIETRPLTILGIDAFSTMNKQFIIAHL